MATERLAPDAILTATNLSGAVTAIQDDPDSPDGSWLTAPGNNNNTEVIVSFGSPSGDLNTGAGLQEFRVLVRKTNHSTNPSCTIQLYENGSAIATLVNGQTVSSTTGTVLSGTWDASSLSAISGVNVECRVTGSTGGGSPGNRASLEVGAIEWNDNYQAGVNLSTSTATLTATGYAPSGSVEINPPGTNTFAEPDSATITATGYAPSVSDGAGGVSLLALAASLAITAFTPSVSVGASEIVTPSTATMSLTGYAPTATSTANVWLSTGNAALALTGYQPDLALGANVGLTAGNATLTLTGNAPSVVASANIELATSSASLTLTGYTPSVASVVPAPASNVFAEPSSALLTAVGYAPQVAFDNNVTLSPYVADLTLSGYVPTVDISTGIGSSVILTPAEASLSVTGYTPSVGIGANVSLSTGNASLTLTAYAPTVSATASVGVTPSTASLAVTGYAPTATASANVWLTPSAASLSITAYGPVVSYSSGYESLYPDAIISQTGSTGAYTDIDDDPDSPDGLWLTTTAQNGTLRVSFPTPSANLRTGAGLQQFRVYVRKVDNTDTPSSGGGDPTLKISVRETGGGSDLAAGSTDIISSTTGVVATFDWNASVLASIDGSGVECYCVTTGDGVGETDERRVQIGAVEWVAATVTTTTVQPYGGSLTLTGYAPTVDASTSAAVTPSTASLTVTGYAPSVTASANTALAPFAAVLSLRAGQNIFQRSEEFTNTYWGKRTGVVLTANSIAAPDGVVSATKLATDSAGGTAEQTIYRSPPATTFSPYTFSVYAKADQTSLLCVGNTGYGSPDGWTYFDLSAGTVAQADSEHTASIVDVGNGWYRCVISTTLTTDSSGFWLFGLASGVGTPTVTRDGNSSVYVWGAQLQDGLSVGAYNKTTTAAITFIPTIAATTNAAVTPSTASLVATGYAPSIAANDSVTLVPSSAVLTFASYAPTLLLGVNTYAYPSTATLSLVSGHNILPYSQEIGSWTSLGTSTVTADAATAPDGTFTADIVNSRGGVYTWQKTPYQQVTGTLGGDYVVSGYFKYTTGGAWPAAQYAFLAFWDGNTAYAWSYFDILNGTFPFDWFGSGGGSVTPFGYVSEDDTTIEDVGDGWYRCTLRVRHTVTYPLPTTAYVVIGGDSNTSGYGTSSSSRSVLAWGVQVSCESRNTGGTVAAPQYIATTSSIVDYRPSVSSQYIVAPSSAELLLVGVEPFIVNSGVVDSISPRDERNANEIVTAQKANHIVVTRTANRRQGTV